MSQNFSLLIKPVSYLCNLRCRYCFYCYDNKAGLGPAAEMREATLENLIRAYTAASQPPYIFAFQGGEPLLAGIGFYRAFINMLNHMLPPRTTVSVAIQTNGTLVNEEWTALFHEMNALIGVSLDGDRELHDANRIDAMGAGSFDRAAAGYRMLINGGVSANILSAVNSLTAQHPGRIYDFLRSEVRADYLQFIPVFDLDHAGAPLPHSVRDDDYYRFVSGIFERWKADVPRPSVRLFDNIYEGLLGQMPSSCQFSGRCGGYYLVEANGNVYPCDFYAESRWYLGNVNADSFDTMASSNRHARFAGLKERYAKKHCRDCDVASLCRGGCPHYSRHGRYEYCETNRRFIPEFRAFIS